MKTLAEMRDVAERDESMREFLIIHPTGGPMNGKFLDPHLGLIEIRHIPGKCVYIKDLDPHKTTGVFLNEHP